VFFGPPGELFEESERHQCRVALVHVEDLDIGLVKRAQHGQAAKPKYCFLAQAIALIAAVKKIGKTAIDWTILIEIGVEKDERDRVSGYSGKNVLPGANAHFSALDGDRNRRAKTFEMGLRRPIGRALHLIALGIQPLFKITFAMDQGDRNHRDS
jgi:hypothetical protein